MQHKLFALSLGFGGVILATHHAFADPAPHCGRPAAKYAAIAIVASGANGTWTTTLRLPQAAACLVASGEDFAPLAGPLPAAG